MNKINSSSGSSSKSSSSSSSSASFKSKSKIAPEILKRLRELASHSALLTDEPRDDENVEFLGLLLYCVAHGMTFGGLERDAGGWRCSLCVDMNKQRVFEALSQ